MGFHIHKGTESLDVAAQAPCTRAQWAAVVSAALTGSDSTLDTAALAAWGSWYQDWILDRSDRPAFRWTVRVLVAPGETW